MTAPSRERATLAIESFHDQFLLSEERLAAPVGWQERVCGRWRLVAHSSLPVVVLRTLDGVEAGFALGWLIDEEGKFRRHELELPVTARDVKPAVLEGFIDRFGGRFLVALLLAPVERMYLDPLGSLAAVWCPQRLRVASTPTVLLHDEPRHPLFRRRPSDPPLDRPDRFWPAELTAAEGVHRLMVNHFLDLKSWKASRHYPAAGLGEASEGEIPQLVATFHRLVRRQIKGAIEEHGGAYLGLTAGHDSRRVLACSRDFIDRLECVTLRGAGRRGERIDSRIATQVASGLALRHHLLDIAPADRSMKESYARRIGYSGGPGKARKFVQPIIGRLDLGRAWMTGHGGGPCTAKYWHSGLWETRPTPERLLAFLELPASPEALESLGHWLQGVPEASPGLSFDLTILELRVGGWVAPHLYGVAPFACNLIPLCHRQIIDTVLRVPCSYRAAGRFNRDLLELAWPELLGFPVNDLTGLQWLLEKARQGIRSKSRGMRGRLAARFH